MLGLTVAGALVVSCGDLFHGTDWETLCGRDPSARGCPESTTSSSHASSGVGGSGGSGGSSTPMGGNGSGGDPCSSYCATVVNDCVGATSQYETSASCEHICEILPHVDVPKADDIPCREGYAAKVKNPSLCAAAGPGGDGKCGTLCDAYCAIMGKNCGPFVGTTAVCGKACEKQYANSVPYSTTVQSGNNLACRLYWAIQSIEDNTMCKNASDDSAVCVDGETM
jgi:hypothetical protein